MVLRTRPIVRPDSQNRMVTKGYQKGVYDRVTEGIGQRCLKRCKLTPIDINADRKAKTALQQADIEHRYRWVFERPASSALSSYWALYAGRRPTQPRCKYGEGRSSCGNARCG